MPWYHFVQTKVSSTSQMHQLGSESYFHVENQECPSLLSLGRTTSLRSDVLMVDPLRERRSTLLQTRKGAPSLPKHDASFLPNQVSASKLHGSEGHRLGEKKRRFPFVRCSSKFSNSSKALIPSSSPSRKSSS